MRKIKVGFFQRKPRPGFNFSLEGIFEDLRMRLSNDIEYQIFICSQFNDGWISKIINIIQATFRQKNDVNHITGEVHFLNLLMHKRRVLLTILDCAPMRLKKGLSKKIVAWLYFKLPLKKAKVVTAISEQTKTEIIEITNCNPNKIVVVPVAVADRFVPFPKKFNAEKPNILQIGTGDHKNLQRLIPALDSISCTLTIVGKLQTAQLDLLEKHKVEFINLTNLTNDQIIECYCKSDIVSFASTSEGFGMPIIEANVVERVVITSNCSSMPEVAGNAACLVNPFDINSIREGILRVINEPEYRNKLLANGRKNKIRFDSQNIAMQYLDIYQSIVKS